MYKFFAEGRLIGIEDKIRYVRIKQETGCLIESDKENADGIAVNGKAYNIPGCTAIDNVPEIYIEKVMDGGKLIYEQLKATMKKTDEIPDLESALVELASIIADQDDALVELAELMEGGD